jgi:hypothetical protein
MRSRIKGPGHMVTMRPGDCATVRAEVFVSPKIEAYGKRFAGQQDDVMKVESLIRHYAYVCPAF